MDDRNKLKILEEKLAKYEVILSEKKKVFRGIKHEDSLSELRYTQYMVYSDMVEGIRKEIKLLRDKIGK